MSFMQRHAVVKQGNVRLSVNKVIAGDGRGGQWQGHAGGAGDGAARSLVCGVGLSHNCSLFQLAAFSTQATDAADSGKGVQAALAAALPELIDAVSLSMPCREMCEVRDISKQRTQKVAQGPATVSRRQAELLEVASLCMPCHENRATASTRSRQRPLPQGAPQASGCCGAAFF